MPLISLRDGQRWLVVDRGGPGKNYEEHYFREHRLVLRL